MRVIDGLFSVKSFRATYLEGGLKMKNQFLICQLGMGLPCFLWSARSRSTQPEVQDVQQGNQWGEWLQPAEQQDQPNQLNQQNLDGQSIQQGPGQQG